MPSTGSKVTAAPTVAELIDEWRLSLRAAGKSPATIQLYGRGVDLFDAYLGEHGMPPAIDAITREHAEAWIVWMGSGANGGEPYAPASVKGYTDGVRSLFTWAVEEGEVLEANNPMRHVKPPKVIAPKLPLLSDEQLSALFKACEGTGFDDRRDMALLRVLYGCGLRLAEVTALGLDDVDLNRQVVAVRRGKGGRPRDVSFGFKTAQELRRYLRVRRRHPLAALPALWIGKKGALTTSGVRQLVDRRGRMAGIEGLHPHQLRHQYAHEALSSGMQEGDLMNQAGWSTRSMVSRYGSAAATERAIEASRRMGVGDRL
jgi:site-specific recombinase XerD